MPDVKADWRFRRLFPNVRSMVVAPISSGQERFGVLDISITKDTGIPPNAPTIATLLGQQLGLYLHLSGTLKELTENRENLKKNLIEFQRSEALREQIQGPDSDFRRP